MTWRIRTLKIFFCIFAFLIFAKLGQWQIVRGKELKDQAQIQHTSKIEIPSRRGQILSSDGFPLADNLENYLLFITPKSYTATPVQTNQLIQILSSTSSASLLEHITTSTQPWLPLSKHVSAVQKSQIEALGLGGIGFEPFPERFYPEGSSSAHLLGFAGQDSNGSPKGYFGLEGYYDRLLSGVVGWQILEHDADNNPIIIGNQNTIPPLLGTNLTTTINRSLQFLIFEKLSASIQKYQAEGGTVTVMEPSTGKILAMVSLPGYDPATYSNYPPQSYKNPVISAGYEPGSTFKVLIMASALDAKVVTPETICIQCDQAVVIGQDTIKTFDDKYHPHSTMSQIIQNSDNVGMVFVGSRLGHTNLLTYLKKFGIGQETGIDLQEESSPPLRPDYQWSDLDYATATFGQGIAVTPIQLLRAVAVIANHGQPVVPHVQDKDIPRNSTSIISATAALQTVQMMVSAVDNNKVGWDRPPGYQIAAKSGTAQIPIKGHYDPDKTIGSFIGFAPAYNPRFIMLVTINQSKKSPWGSRTAAPLWFDIARDIIRIFQIRPE